MARVIAREVAKRGADYRRMAQDMHVVAAIELAEFAEDMAAASGMSVVEASRLVVRDSAIQTLQLAQMFAATDTGQMRSQIKIVYEEGGMSAKVVAMAPHSVYIEFGTGMHNELLPPAQRRPYVIEPRRPDGVLRFVTKDGDVVFTRRVIHPGIKAQPFMRPAAERVADAFARGLAEAATKTIIEGAA
jgi:hypothetical protein